MRSRSSLQCCSQAPNPLCLHRLRQLLQHLLRHLPLRLLKPLPFPPGRLPQVCWLSVLTSFSIHSP